MFYICIMQNNQYTTKQINDMALEQCACGCPYFEEVTIIKKQPALLAATKKDLFVNILYLACKNCHNPHMGFIEQNYGPLAVPIMMRAPAAAADNVATKNPENGGEAYVLHLKKD